MNEEEKGGKVNMRKDNFLLLYTQLGMIKIDSIDIKDTHRGGWKLNLFVGID